MTREERLYCRRVSMFVIRQYAERAKKDAAETLRAYALNRARYWLDQLRPLESIEELELEDAIAAINELSAKKTA
jgi:hypothetical protein